MKKRIMLSGILFIIIIISVLVYFNKNNNDLENVLQNKKYNETISMMLETASGSGEYEKTTASGWPTEGYVFNEELSRCEYGSTLSWDDENNKVVMSGNTSDKCYVYFDKVNIIPFTINGTEYNAIEGMTWGEWINSDYNVEDAYGISSDGYVKFKRTDGTFYYFDSFISKDELIIENGKYTHKTSGMPDIEP
jgi:hypothetical protein